MQNTNEVGLCGTTQWKAAKAVSKSMTNLDETCLEVAGCRHALTFNMFYGENLLQDYIWFTISKASGN